MARGRKRKVGLRSPCGKLLQPTPAQRAEDERAAVLAQPHRRGESSQLAESAIGRFCLRHNLRRELYDAAIHYATTRQKYVAAYGCRDALAKFDGGTGADLDMKVVHGWRDETVEGKSAMRHAGGRVGFQIISTMLLEGRDFPPESARAHPAAVKAAIASLMGLAVCQGRLDRRALAVA